MRHDITPIRRTLGGGMMDFIRIGIIRHSLFVWDIDRIIPDFSIHGISVNDPGM
jgi:hypothetical protein